MLLSFVIWELNPKGSVLRGAVAKADTSFSYSCCNKRPQQLSRKKESLGLQFQRDTGLHGMEDWAAGGGGLVSGARGSLVTGHPGWQSRA